MNIRQVMHTSPVIPVIVIEDLDTAVPLAEALVAGGLKVLEITLRTSAAMQAMEQIASEVPDAMVGVGTVTSASEVQKAKDNGATFVVSPGYTHAIGQACFAADLPYLPGVMTPGDIMRAQEDGLDALKFFPAAQAGGISFLKSLRGPFPNIVFCPTGGIGASDYSDYLALDNVLCVGGSWVAPAELVRQRDWQQISSLAKDCFD